MATLTNFVSQSKPGDFKPPPFYSRDGDSLFFHFKPDPSYADRIDGFFTLYRSIENQELTGCQIKGVQCIPRRLGVFGVRITDHKTVDLRMIFLGYRASVDDSTQEALEELSQAAEEAGAHIDSDELSQKKSKIAGALMHIVNVSLQHRGPIICSDGQ